MKWLLIASSSLLLSLVTLATIASADHVSEDSIAFQSDVYSPGDTAEFIVVDEALSQPSSCTAAWGPISRTVLITEWWNISTGEPEPQVFSIDVDCAFNIQDPPRTPLRIVPAPKIKMDGNSVLASELDTEAGAFKLFHKVNASSTVSAFFYFDVQNIYLPADGLIVVSSSSDVEGERAGLREVAGEMGQTDSPDSGMFLGRVDLSGNPDARADGDGAVYVQGGDVLTARYLDGNGEEIATSQATVQGILPTPTPIPAAGVVASTALALSLAAILAWKLTRLESTRKDT